MLDLCYHHLNNGGDFTPKKIAEVIGHNVYWSGSFCLSITPTNLVVRGYSETTKSFFVLSSPIKTWGDKESWKEVKENGRLTHEMNFAPEFGVYDPGDYPSKEAQVFWEKSHYFGLAFPLDSTDYRELHGV